MNPKGWHSRGYLPHFDSPETIQFLTFRLFDSLPREALEKLRLIASPIADADRDAFLDAGAGNCWLKQPEIAQILQDALLHF
jgi:putative transposase